MKQFFTAQEYLELERKADYRSEYYCGELFTSESNIFVELPNLFIESAAILRTAFIHTIYKTLMTSSNTGQVFVISEMVENVNAAAPTLLVATTALYSFIGHSNSTICH